MSATQATHLTFLHLIALLMQNLEFRSSSLCTIIHFPMCLIVPFGITIPTLLLQWNAKYHHHT